MTVQTAERLTAAPTGDDFFGREILAERRWSHRMEPDLGPVTTSSWAQSLSAQTEQSMPPEGAPTSAEVLTSAQVAQDALSKQLAEELKLAKEQMDANTEKAKKHPESLVMIGAWLLERDPHPFKTRKPRSRRTQ